MGWRRGQLEEGRRKDSEGSCGETCPPNYLFSSPIEHG
jgi:hypothetical protein